MRGSPARGTAAALLSCAAVLLAGCAGQPGPPRPTIGSPAAATTPSATVTQGPNDLAEQWDLTGTALPPDWPDVPLPRGATVVNAYAIGAEPRRTWSATFTTSRGTALDLAEPVVTALRDLDFVPIAEYVGAAETNTGLFSFAAPSFAVYVVLGEDDGQPNLVITVRGSADESADATDSSTGSGSATPFSSGAPSTGAAPPAPRPAD